MTTATDNPSGSAPVAARLPAIAVLAAAIAVLVFAFWVPLWQLAGKSWAQEEYSHGPMIPFIALFLLATRLRELFAVPWQGAGAGYVVLAGAFGLLLFGNLSAIYTISHIGFVVGVWGCFLAVLGWPALRIAWPALFYLFFMIGLPDFLQFKLSGNLQMWSSQLGVAVIRAAGVPVYLEGNVIDLGVYRLEVAEACSGLRYLFPLMSFGFLCAALFAAPLWQRAVVFLSSIPLTVLLNSLRIGIIGILVNHFGIEQAEGFLHDFEGWVIFMTCVAIMFLLMWLMVGRSWKTLLRSLRMDVPPLGEVLAGLGAKAAAPRTAVAALAAVVAGTALAAAVNTRQESIPARASLSTFPLVIGDWRGREDAVEKIILNKLKADDTFLADYGRDADPAPVNLWIAYYSSQRQGESVHSPSSCLPADGWLMESFGVTSVPDVTVDGGAQPVNRAVIRKGEAGALVYYWFAQRGRVLTNEYLVKWYIFWDSITMNRTDGALVRLTTPVGPDPASVEAADRRLQQFMRDVEPRLAYFLPPRDAAPQAGGQAVAAGTP